jgi:hypothetical protein
MRNSRSRYSPFEEDEEEEEEENENDQDSPSIFTVLTSQQSQASKY